MELCDSHGLCHIPTEIWRLQASMVVIDTGHLYYKWPVTINDGGPQKKGVSNWLVLQACRACLQLRVEPDICCGIK